MALGLTPAATRLPALSFWTAFANSVAMIIVTELGDKTFFIAAVMAMRHPRLVVYAGAMGALAGMTVLSAVIGYALPQLLPRIYTHYASIGMFAFFGFKLLSEAYELYKHKGPSKKNEELEEVEAELGGKHEAGDSSAEHHDVEGGRTSPTESASATTTPARMAIFVQAFTLTFFAEWGDRSQIATIALAAVHDPIGVTIGGTLGHACCTGLAVLGGRLLATRISERQVALAGGVLFLMFALHSLWAGP
jgi:putative Ca2+/H+ antiporter (TMEM165/GDT1 family)